VVAHKAGKTGLNAQLWNFIYGGPPRSVCSLFTRLYGGGCARALGDSVMASMFPIVTLDHVRVPGNVLAILDVTFEGIMDLQTSDGLQIIHRSWQ
jgi:hypothetical protein